jgi:hypothetical protein
MLTHKMQSLDDFEAKSITLMKECMRNIGKGESLDSDRINKLLKSLGSDLILTIHPGFALGSAECIQALVEQLEEGTLLDKPLFTSAIQPRTKEALIGSRSYFYRNTLDPLRTWVPSPPQVSRCWRS